MHSKDMTLILILHQSLPREKSWFINLGYHQLVSLSVSSLSSLNWVAKPNKAWASYIQNFASNLKNFTFS